MKPIYVYLSIITLAVILAAGCYFWGKTSVKCPEMDTPILPPENDSIRYFRNEIITLKNKLKNQKNEIKYKIDTVYVSDSSNGAIPAIFSNWANYYTIR